MGFFKKLFIYRSLASFKAQATMEYILLLVVVMAIALGIGGPLGNHLKKFSGAMVGEKGYYACLTRCGVLPGPAYKSQLKKCKDDCVNNPSLSSAVASLERIGKEGSGGPGGLNRGLGASGSNSAGAEGKAGSATGDGSNNQGKLNKTGQNRGASKRHRIKKSSSSGSGRGGSTAGSSDDSFAGLSSFPVNQSEGKKKAQKKRKKRKFKARGEDPVGSGFSGTKKKKRRTAARVRVIRGQGYLGEEVDYISEPEQRKEVFKVREEISKKATKTEAEKKAKQIQSEKLKKTKALEDKDKGINFGGFMKYLIIAIMIIVVIVVIFSQVMEYQSKD